METGNEIRRKKNLNQNRPCGHMKSYPKRYLNYLTWYHEDLMRYFCHVLN